MTTRILNTSAIAIRNHFIKTEKKAKEVSIDKEKAGGTLKSAWTKAYTRKAELESIWVQLKLLFELVNDYIKGNYTEVPYRSIVAVFSGIIYFISPIDAIPDVILGFGFVDDVFILSLIIKQLEADLRKYQNWRENN